MTTSEKLMDASQKLAKLSERAKEAEDHASAAQNQAKADVEKSANEARARAEAHAEELHQSAAATGAQISASWNDMQRSWSGDGHLGRSVVRGRARSPRQNTEVGEPGSATGGHADARDRIRTCVAFRPEDFKSPASTNSATRAGW